MSTYTPADFRHLQEMDWDDIGRRLTLYAVRRAMFYGWADNSLQLLPGRDFTIDDIVQHVLLKTLRGERPWKPSRGPLFPWLKLQVNSVMDAWIKGKSGKHEVSFGNDEINEEAGEKNEVITIEEAEDKTSPKPEESVLDEESAQEVSDQVGLIFEAITGDAELVQLVEYISENGETRPRVVAQELGTTVANINNRKKRLLRRMSQRQLSS